MLQTIKTYEDEQTEKIENLQRENQKLKNEVLELQSILESNGIEFKLSSKTGK